LRAWPAAAGGMGDSGKPALEYGGGEEGGAIIEHYGEGWTPTWGSGGEVAHRIGALHGGASWRVWHAGARPHKPPGVAPEWSVMGSTPVGSSRWQHLRRPLTGGGRRWWLEEGDDNEVPGQEVVVVTVPAGEKLRLSTRLKKVTAGVDPAGVGLSTRRRSSRWRRATRVLQALRGQHLEVGTTSGSQRRV
jgi:hypothetical protein